MIISNDILFVEQLSCDSLLLKLSCLDVDVMNIDTVYCNVVATSYKHWWTFFWDIVSQAMTEFVVIAVISNHLLFQECQEFPLTTHALFFVQGRLSLNSWMLAITSVHSYQCWSLVHYLGQDKLWFNFTVALSCISPAPSTKEALLLCHTSVALVAELSSTSCCSMATKYCPRRSSSSSSWKITVWLVVVLVWCFRWCCSTLYKRKLQHFDTDYSDAHRTFVRFSFYCVELWLPWSF